MDEKFTLLADIYGYKGRQQIAQVGDKVSVISSHDDILIVQNEKGDKFSVNVKKVEKVNEEKIKL